MISDILPGVHNLALYRGDTFAQVFRFSQGGEPLVLPTVGWMSEIRTPDGFGEVTGTFTIDASQAGVGEIVLSATAAQVAAFENGAYDIRLVEGAETTQTFIRGTVRVTKDVTRG